MKIPKPVAEDMLAYLRRAIDASAQTLVAIHELDELVESGFGARAIKRIEAMLEDIDTIEGDTDDQQVLIRSTLFSLESEWPPVDIDRKSTRLNSSHVRISYAV